MVLGDAVGIVAVAEMEVGTAVAVEITVADGSCVWVVPYVFVDGSWV